MIRRRLAANRGREAGSDHRAAYFGCTNCRAEFDEWIEDCPRCEHLVARFVVPSD